MISKVTGIKKTITVATMITVGSLNSLVINSAFAQTAPQFSGELNVKGVVTLNDVNVASGTTVLNSGKIKTADNGFAIINLGRLGQVELAAGSELVLKVENGTIGGNLRTGRAVVNAPAGVSVNIATTEGVAVTDGKDAAVVTVDVSCGNTRVSSSKSDAKVLAGSRVEAVAAGQEVAVGNPAAQAPNCKRLAVAPAAAGLAPGALAALLLAGIGSAIVGIVAVTQNDTSASSVNISGFRP